MTKTFSLAQVLTITTGRLLCPIGGVYEILNHITGDNLFTHVLPRAGRFAQPLLNEAFPELWIALGCIEEMEGWLERDKTPDKSEFVKMWLAELRMMNPAIMLEYEVPSFEDRWLSMNPMEELAGMVSPEKIVVAELA